MFFDLVSGGGVPIYSSFPFSLNLQHEVQHEETFAQTQAAEYASYEDGLPFLPGTSHKV